jgi:hypothetical protein
MPGIHIALNPAIRLHRIKMSCIVDPNAWPMCNEPVTLGGGNVIEYGTMGLASLAWKNPFSIQNRIHRASTSDGSYCLGSAELFTRNRLTYQAKLRSAWADRDESIGALDAALLQCVARGSDWCVRPRP